MKKKIIWIGLIVLCVVIAGIFMKLGKQALVVDMGTVVKGNIDKYVEETAVVKLADETAIYAREGGNVIDVKAEIGAEVKAGDLLVRMDDTAVLLQMKDLEAQKQSIAAQYAEAKNPANDAKIRSLNAQVRSAEASYAEAKTTADNNKVLYDEGAISLDMYQSSLTNLTTIEANLETAKSNLALAENGVSSNVKKQYEAQLAEIQARIALLDKNRNDLNITAPISGMILAKEVEKGSMVQPGSLLVALGNKSSIFLESDVLVDDISQIKLGTPVVIENLDLGIKGIKGTVRKIYPQAFSKISELGIEQKRVKIEIDFNETVADLKSGYDMTVNMITASKQNTLLIDEKAVFDYQGKGHVFVNENGLAKLRPIEKGIESDNRVEVLSGLKEGEKVILSPDEKLKEGTKIKSAK
jgi:HlyD family secretion protein